MKKIIDVCDCCGLHKEKLTAVKTDFELCENCYCLFKRIINFSKNEDNFFSDFILKNTALLLNMLIGASDEGVKESFGIQGIELLNKARLELNSYMKKNTSSTVEQ